MAAYSDFGPALARFGLEELDRSEDDHRIASVTFEPLDGDYL